MAERLANCWGFLDSSRVLRETYILAGSESSLGIIAITCIFLYSKGSLLQQNYFYSHSKDKVKRSVFLEKKTILVTWNEYVLEINFESLNYAERSL